MTGVNDIKINGVVKLRTTLAEKKKGQLFAPGLPLLVTGSFKELRRTAPL
jgi:hypothetical protein